MDVKKICPLFYNPGGFQGKTDCLKEGCWWWIDEAQECSVPLLAKQGLAVKKTE